jgi:hypothetical protein
MKSHSSKELINREKTFVPILPWLLQIPHWLSRVQTRASALRDEWLIVSLHEQIIYFLGFEGNDVPRTTKVQNSPFPSWRANISKGWTEIPRQCALSYVHCMCLHFGARNVFIKRSLESGTSRKCVKSVFSIIACSHACRAVHRQCVPKYTK